MEAPGCPASHRPLQGSTNTFRLRLPGAGLLQRLTATDRSFHLCYFDFTPLLTGRLLFVRQQPIRSAPKDNHPDAASEKYAEASDVRVARKKHGGPTHDATGLGSDEQGDGEFAENGQDNALSVG